MFKDKLNFVLIIVLFVVTIFFFTESYVRNEIILNKASIYYREETVFNSKYKTDLELSKLSDGRVNTYFPRYKQANLDSAHIYGGIFDLMSNFEEYDDSYVFSDMNSQLIIYKFVNKVAYKKDVFIDPDSSAEITPQEAILIAEKFYYDNLLDLNYEEALVEFEDGVYYIAFIGRLGNLKNFGFTDNVRITADGDIVGLEYYYATYEKLNAFKIKSKYEAYTELPVDFAEDKSIYITDCQLVYIYEDSIVQPAYYFQGEIEDGTYFEAFVKAILFD